MKSDKYWAARAEQRMYKYHLQADTIADEIAQSYIKASDYLNTELKKIIGAFTNDSGISETEAKNIIKNFGGTAADKTMLQQLALLADKISDPQKKQEFINLLNAPATTFRINRISSLQRDIDKQTGQLAQLEENITTEHYTNLAGEAYYRTIFDIQKGTGIGFTFSAMPASRINEILSNNWSGKLFSERIWGKAEDLNIKIKNELLTGFMTGRPYKKTADAIQKDMAVSAMEARRLVRTESTYIANMAEQESYKESGIKKYKYVATLDAHTSDICQSLDGKQFDVADGMPGVNMPAMHPWCRSTTIAVIDGAVMDGLQRRARNPKTGKNELVPADMTYPEWKKSLDERYGEGFMDREITKARNLGKDKKQYTQFKSVLGKEFSAAINLKKDEKGIDIFREIKYNNSERWKYLKDFYKYKNVNKTALKMHFDIYSELKKAGIDNGIVLPPKQQQAFILADTDDKRDPYHIMKRMRERNITDDDVKSYATDAKVMFNQWQGKRQVYYSNEGAAVVKQLKDGTKIFKTAWSKYDFKAESEKIMEVVNKYVT